MVRPLSPPVRFRVADLRALDADHSGSVTARDVAAGTGAKATGITASGASVDVVLTAAPNDIGRAARLFAFTKGATADVVDVPEALLHETAPERALLAADSYEPYLRTAKIPDVLDALLAHADTKIGVFAGGIAGRSFGVVGADGSLQQRTATYDGKIAYLYCVAGTPEADALVAAAKDPKYARVEVRVITRAQLDDRDERLAMKLDRPGMFYVPTSSPVSHDDAYMVPGGRFGLELYYHDARINSVSAHNTVVTCAAAGDVDGAERALSALRGTASALVNEVLTYGKAFNASMTTSVGRSQAPCLTTVIKETYAAWTSLHPDQIDAARTWLSWAVGAAEKEYASVWMAPPRLDEATGLSGYLDETPTQAPEEAPHFYEGMAWSVDDIKSDAAVREHGWDSMPGALLTDGPDRGKPRMHELLPVDLQCLLYRYETDLCALADSLGAPNASTYAAAADKRKATMNKLMWSERAGCYRDVVRGTGKQNGAEDLRSLMPLWAGLVDDDPARAKKMIARVHDYLRPGGLATATTQNWLALFRLNPSFVGRCQWGHKDIGWPIATYETVAGLKRSGADKLADEIAYRWCLAVQHELDTAGGLHEDERGGFTAPVFEKMNVTSTNADAAVGYGNQGAGKEGDGGGFRWGVDGYKLLYRGLPRRLQDALAQGVDPAALFDARLR